MAYVPSPFGGELTLDGLRIYLEQELLQLSRSLQETTALDLRPVHAEPLRPREGMIVCADGTDWDPGSGAGIYAYLSSAWSKL